MRSIIALVSVAVVGAALFNSVRADMPGGHTSQRPRSIAPYNAVPILIEANDNAREPRLIVPKALARRARESKIASTPPATGRVEGPTILFPVGGAVVLSYAGAGFCLLCGRAVTRRLLLLLALVGAGGGAVWATPPLRQAQRAESPAELPLDGVAVELVDQGDALRLIVPRPLAAKLRAAAPQ